MPERFTGERAFSTCIYFLLTDKAFSAFHAMAQDEVWHFYTGSSLTIHIINQKGKYNAVKLGNDNENGGCFQTFVKAGSWFAAAVNIAKSYSLVACTTAPGFEFADFEMADRSRLIELYPEHRNLIEKFT